MSKFKTKPFSTLLLVTPEIIPKLSTFFEYTQKDGKFRTFKIANII